MKLQTDNKRECSSAVNNVSADSLLAGSINSYCFLVINVLTVVWLAALTLILCFFRTKQKTKMQKFNYVTVQHWNLLLFLHIIRLDKIVFRETGMVSVGVIFTLFMECHIIFVINTKTQTPKQCFQQCGFNSVQTSTDTVVTPQNIHSLHMHLLHNQLIALINQKPYF